MNRMSVSELRGYQQICGSNGAIMVIACDQRGGIRSLLAADKAGQAAIADGMLGDVKADVTRYLAAHAPCILLDPICAVPRVVEEAALPRDVALLTGIDASGYDTDAAGHYKSRLAPGITARRVRELAGTGGKLMVYLRPDHASANGHNTDIISHCIADFAAEDLLLVVEFLAYPLPGETPGACAAVTAMAGSVPWPVLSAGVDHETFVGQVEIAMANGASGVIAGRSLWKDCVSLDRGTQRRLLETRAVPRLREIQAILARYPRPLSRAA